MRKHQTNTINGHLDAMRAASQPFPECPDHLMLPDAAKPFWEAIMASRGSAEWDGASMMQAALLARTQAQIEQENAALDVEGSIIRNGRGNPMINPRALVLQQLTTRSLALMRGLRLTGTGKRRDVLKARALENEMRMTLEDLDPDGLLARP
jgi:hypothetical protein